MGISYTTFLTVRCNASPSIDIMGIEIQVIFSGLHCRHKSYLQPPYERNKTPSSKFLHKIYL